MSLDENQVLTIFPRNSRPFGYTYEQWTQKWWVWLLKIPKGNNPTSDRTGKNAYIGQDNPEVFFLCQTFEQIGVKPSRLITIHKGTSLFFPLINWISVFPEDGITDKDLELKAQAKMNTIGDLMISINGNVIKGLHNYRIQSPPFHVYLPKNNILNLNAGIKRVASDGYWILTRPITGTINLKTFGSCTAGVTKIGVSYNIQVCK